jgi:transcriptional regulator with XRE-family HTH domain
VARPGFDLDGAALYAARLRARLTCAELAERVGCSYWTVWALERGERRAGLVLLRKLEQELRVSARQLGADVPDQEQ